MNFNLTKYKLCIVTVYHKSKQELFPLLELHGSISESIKHAAADHGALTSLSNQKHLVCRAANLSWLILEAFLDIAE